MARPDYQRGDTVIIITWDESGGGATQAACGYARLG
jgi:hypothetical protein